MNSTENTATAADLPGLIGKLERHHSIAFRLPDLSNRHMRALYAGPIGFGGLIEIVFEMRTTNGIDDVTVIVPGETEIRYAYSSS